MAVNQNIDQILEGCRRRRTPLETGVTEQGVQIGPLQNAAQFQKARNFLAAAAKDGTIVAGGRC
jgi:acyl-CoA reductase-like NAD-dependent aldehyde dehydrogenase